LLKATGSRYNKPKSPTRVKTEKTLSDIPSYTQECIGLIPAASKGLRLGLPYPKELYPIIRDNRYKPVAQFVLENLTTAGIQHIVFVINEAKSQLVGYFGSGARFKCNISYVIQEPSPLNELSTSPVLANALDAAYHLRRGKMVYFGMADTIMQPTDVFARAQA
jgi:glucose-1-phosphate thymidylyltransferase